MIRVNGDRMTLMQFQSITDLDDYLSTATENVVFRGKTLESRKTSNPSFHGTKSWEEAHSLLVQGWSPEAEKLENRLRSETIPDAIKRAVSVYDFAGQTACVPRYLNGMPDSMINRKMITRKAPVVELFRGITYPHYYTQKQIEDDGLYTLQLVQELERRNVRVKLHVYHTTHEIQTHGMTLVIKQPEERLNVSKIAFPLVHTSMLRRVAWRVLETNQDVVDYRLYAGYGSHTDGDFTNFLKKQHPNAHFVAGYSRHTQDALEQEVSKILRSAK